MSWEDVIKQRVADDRMFSSTEKLIEAMERTLERQSDGKPLKPTDRPIIEIDRQVFIEIIAELKDAVRSDEE